MVRMRILVVIYVLICVRRVLIYGEDINNGNKACVSACSVTGFFADPLTRVCVAECNMTAGLYGISLPCVVMSGVRRVMVILWHRSV